MRTMIRVILAITCPLWLLPFAACIAFWGFAGDLLETLEDEL